MTVSPIISPNSEEIPRLYINEYNSAPVMAREVSSAPNVISNSLSFQPKSSNSTLFSGFAPAFCGAWCRLCNAPELAAGSLAESSAGASSSAETLMIPSKLIPAIRFLKMPPKGMPPNFTATSPMPVRSAYNVPDSTEP